jgi:hypothetical protein
VTVSLIHLTKPEKKVLADWRRLLGTFVSREWMMVFGWFGAGALLAGLFRLGWSDRAFRAFIKTTYVPTGLRFDNPSSYVPLPPEGGRPWRTQCVTVCQRNSAITL